MTPAVLCDLVLQSWQSAATPDARLQVRLYSALRDAILQNHLAPGMQLPSTRHLSAELGLGRNTVLRAYGRLLSEGYVVGAAGSGTYVAETLPDRTPIGRRPRASATPGDAAQLSTRGCDIAAHLASSTLQSGAFTPGIPDVTLFPFDVWRRLLMKYLRREHSQLLQYAVGGYGPLKASLCEYLRATRLIQCRPQQILILNGSHQAIDLCARMLTDVGDMGWMEDPGYWGARNVLRAAGLRIKPVSVDEEGLAAPPELWHAPPKLIFVSPSCQYPTGAVLSLRRRRALLERAAECGSWIIEDDYDNELRYHRNPIASLFSLATSDQVMYLGTFTKVMFPGLRLAYLVVPDRLVDAMSIGNAELYREGRLVEQAALAEFIAEGYFASHIRKMRVIYAERQQILRDILGRRLGDALTLSGGRAGIHLLYYFSDEVDDESVSQAALARGIVTRPLSVYYDVPARRRSGLMLGYAGVATEQIAGAANRLADVIEEQLTRCVRSRRGPTESGVQPATANRYGKNLGVLAC